MREGAPELGRFDVSSWFGVFLPKGCPPEIVNALNLQVKAMLEREEIRKNIAAMGARADYGTPQQFSDFVDTETKKFAAIIEKEGLQMEVK
jgi:tripartite-type tricarboxylate transporter receptor subunit TctC